MVSKSDSRRSGQGSLPRSICLSISQLIFRFPGAIKHIFYLKFHPTFSTHYPPTFPKLLPLHVPTSLTMPPHHSPTFSIVPTHSTHTPFPPLPPHSTHTPFSPSQLTTLSPFPAHLHPNGL